MARVDFDLSVEAEQTSSSQASAALSLPLGLAAEDFAHGQLIPRASSFLKELPDGNISASSNPQAKGQPYSSDARACERFGLEACTSVRLFSGVNRMKCAFGGPELNA